MWYIVPFLCLLATGEVVLAVRLRRIERIVGAIQERWEPIEPFIPKVEKEKTIEEAWGEEKRDGLVVPRLSAAQLVPGGRKSTIFGEGQRSTIFGEGQR